jgi:hypothetical protein
LRLVKRIVLAERLAWISWHRKPKLDLPESLSEEELDRRVDRLTVAVIGGAHHSMRLGGKRGDYGDPRPRLMKLLTEWTRERFAP